MSNANDRRPPVPEHLPRGARGDVWRGPEGWRTVPGSDAAGVARRRDTGEDWERRGMDTIRAPGPKNFVRSDSRIREQVCELLEDADVDASAIEVTVADGEVTLAGHVESRSAKRLAEDIVCSCHGVRECHNRLRTQAR